MTTKVQSNSDGSSSILNGAVEAIHIATDGKVAFPQLPCFFVGKTVTQVALAATPLQVTFDNVASNSSDYDAGTSTFTAPIVGFYQFNWTIGTDGTVTIIDASLMVNGVLTGASSRGVAGSSTVVVGSTVTRLAAGDKVTITAISTAQCTLTTVCTFSGFLVKGLS